VPLTFSTRPALVAYLTCGDPDLETSRRIALAAIEAGAEIIELGVPFSDPVADGPVIQRASQRALERGTTLRDVLDLAREIRKQATEAGLIIFTYLNPIWRFGLEKFADAARQARVDGVLFIDLTVEEAGDYLRIMRSRGLATIFLAAPTSTDKRLRRIAKASSGFIYAVSRTGVTGQRSELPIDAHEVVKRLRKFSKLPVAVGFGISTAQQVAAVGKFAEGAVVGSSVVNAIEQASPADAPARVAELIGALKGSSQRSATKNAISS
jgi:tryptophan synthase alpha chain